MQGCNCIPSCFARLTKPTGLGLTSNCRAMPMLSGPRQRGLLLNLLLCLLFSLLIALCSNIHDQTLCKGMTRCSPCQLNIQLPCSLALICSHFQIGTFAGPCGNGQGTGVTMSHCCGAAVSPQAHCSRGWRPTYCAFGHPLVLPYCCRQSNGPKARPRLPSRPWQSFRNCTCHGQTHYAKWH